MIDWLYRTSLEVSLLIGLVLILRPIVRHQLGAHIAYWLWIIPVIRCVMWDKPEIPVAIMEKITLPEGEILLRIFPNPDNFIIPVSFPIEWIWLTGFFFWLVVRVIGWRHLQICLIENSEPINISDELKKFVSLKCSSSKISYFKTTIPSAPFLTGLLESKIYLPQSFFNQYSDIQQQCILEHELTHLKRGDLWLQLIAELIRALFWFNPVIHLACSAFREDQELACDQQVLQNCTKEVRYEYGRALVKGFHAHILPATLAFFSNKKERFIMLEKHKNSKLQNILGISLCLLIGVFALTKAPQAIANNSEWTEETLRFTFEYIPLSNLTKIIFDFAKKDVVGTEQLEKILVTASVESVKPIDAANVVLKCHGFMMQDEGEHYRIVQVETGVVDAKECVVSGLN